MQKRAIILFLVIALFLSACGSQQNAVIEEPQEENWVLEETKLPDGNAAIENVDTAETSPWNWHVVW